MLVTDVHQTSSFTRITRLDAINAEELEQTFAEMERTALGELVQEQFPREQLATLRSAGMRYRGQSYEVSVPVTSLQSDADLAALAERFHDAHRRRYGHMAQSEAVEIVNFQVTAVGTIPKPQFQELASQEQRPAPHETRTAYFGPSECNQGFGVSPLGASARRGDRRTSHHRRKDLDRRALSGPTCRR